MEEFIVMVRRTLVIGVFVALAQLASGCCCWCEHIKERRAYRHGAACEICAPCGCGSTAYASPIIVSPATEPIPLPKKMPTAGMIVPDATMTGLPH